MSDCSENSFGHELEYLNMYGKIDDSLRMKQRANCIHCQERMWVIYERSHVESCAENERGYPLATKINANGDLIALRK